MTKPISWTARARDDLDIILKFNTTLHGVEKAKKIVFDLKKQTRILENPKFDFSEMGMIDDEFPHLKHEYRKLIHGCHKITYRVGKTKIYIARVFDMRRDPKKNL